MKRPFEVGDKIYGFCNGFFGRGCYANKICVALGEKWAVFEDVGDGFARLINCYSEEESKTIWGCEDYFYKCTQEWKIKDGDYDE